MKFAIRDDDTNYFTQPGQLERVYGRVWERCPVSLSVVPFHACTRTGAIPKEYWRGDRVFPLGENEELVRFLREKVAEGKVLVNQHGYSHRDDPTGHEFEAGDDLARKVREGKRYLENLFGVEIETFVPPHNALSRRGFEAVTQSYGCLLGPLPHSPAKRPWQLRNVVNFLRWRWFCLQKTGRWGPTVAYPFPLDYGHYAEFICTSLTPLVSFARLQRGFAAARAVGGSFCLATHYWELGNPLVAALFEQFWRLVSSVGQVEFVGTGALFDRANRSR